MFALPLYIQYRLVSEIDDMVFDRVKIINFDFLFRAVGGESVSKHGIVKSLLYVQIQGYLVALFSSIFFVVCFLLNIEKESFVTITIFIALFVHLFIVAVIVSFTGFVSNKREKKIVRTPEELLSDKLFEELAIADRIRNKEKRKEAIDKAVDKNTKELLDLLTKIEKEKKDKIKLRRGKAIKEVLEIIEEPETLEIANAFFSTTEIVLTRKKGNTVIKFDEIRWLEYKIPIRHRFFPTMFPGYLIIYFYTKVNNKRRIFIKMEFKDYLDLPEIYHEKSEVSQK